MEFVIGNPQVSAFDLRADIPWYFACSDIAVIVYKSDKIWPAYLTNVGRNRPMSSGAYFELKFESLLKLSSEVFPDSERKEVKHFMDVNEYVLALETYIGVVLEEGKRIPAECMLIVDELIETMGIDVELAIEKLHRSTQ